jgi:hypothetical protein
MKPVCFMIMPSKDACNSGGKYLPVRADRESGSVITKEMLNRLQAAAGN